MWEPKYVTLVSGESPDHSLDGLADGFMRWLGKERVRLVLTLNSSADLSEFQYFQPVYEWARTSTILWSPDETELLIISMRSMNRVEEWLFQQKFHCPLATIDGRDKPCDEVIRLHQISSVQVAFKREMTYSSQERNVYSCPYGVVPETLPPGKSYADRSIPVAFISGYSNITRPDFAQAIRSLPDAKVIFDKHIPRTEYLSLLADTQISVACYGAGFISYRYFEIPYYGSLLVAQPLPILMPYGFRHGQHALFAMTPDECLEQIQWARTHPQEAQEIAHAGTSHLLKYHLTTHRAQWVSHIVSIKLQQWMAEQALKFPY